MASDLDALTRAKDALEAYYAAEEAHTRFVARCERNESFYVGDQIDEGLEEFASRQRVSPKIVPMIRPIVATLHGTLLRDQVSPAFLPAEPSDEALAAVGTALLTSVFESSGYHEAEAQAILDGLITSRGYLDVRISTERNILGEVVFTPVDPREVVVPAGARHFDPDTWPEVLLARWMTAEEIELTYGAAARTAAERIASKPGGTAAPLVKVETLAGDLTRTRVLVLERQVRRRRRERMLVNVTTGDRMPVPAGWSEERLRALTQEPGSPLAVQEVTHDAIWWTVQVGDDEIVARWSPYPWFTLVAWAPWHVRGRTVGLVDDLIGPQILLNESETSFSRIIRRFGSTAWHVEEGALVNMTEDEFEERAAEDGVVFVTRRNRPAPEQVSTAPNPAGLEIAAQKALAFLQQVSGVSLDTTALSGRGATGRQSAQRAPAQPARAGALDQLVTIAANLYRMRRAATRRVLDLIQAYYTEERVVRAVGQIVPSEVVTALLNDLSVGRYDLVVGTTPRAQTLDDITFDTLLRLADAGVPIPPEDIVRVSPLPEREALAAKIEALAGRGQPSPEEQKQAQLAQEMQLRMAMTELAKAEAEVTALQAKAARDMAQAQTAPAEVQAKVQEVMADYEARLANLQASVAKQREVLANKLELASMHIEAKKQQKLLDAILEPAQNGPGPGRPEEPTGRNFPT